MSSVRAVRAAWKLPIINVEQAGCERSFSIKVHNARMSVRFQMVLPDELAFQLKEAGVRLRIPLAQFIRETMEEELRQAKPNEPPRYPFASIRGIVGSPETDLSARVDEILYGGEPHR